MIEINNIRVYGYQSAIRGMRFAMESQDNSDSIFFDPAISCRVHCTGDKIKPEEWNDKFGNVSWVDEINGIGSNDEDLMSRLARSGSDHAKYRRAIHVTMDISAPLYWWKEFDTYKIGTVSLSTSTMHTIMKKNFDRSMFSTDHLDDRGLCMLDDIIGLLNTYRTEYIEAMDNKDGKKTKDIWYSLIQTLPSSFNQLRMIELNYEVLYNIHHARQNHKLKEWRDFVKIMRSTVPFYDELIVRRTNDTE